MLKKIRLFWRPTSIIFMTTIILFGFQNCGNDMAFTDAETLSELGFNEDDVLCNPLDPSAQCDLNSKAGLVGSLYYLSANQASIFNGNLNNALLEDYIVYGTRVNKLILMSEVNAPTQNWDQGFAQADGSFVKDLNGNTLHEWFSLDLDGYISLPAGEYQFAMLADDGMKVSFNDKIIMIDDGTHSPRYKCSAKIAFGSGEKKKIDIQYFQGPRTQIAMVFMMRPASAMTNSCDGNGGWQVVGPSAFSYAY